MILNGSTTTSTSSFPYTSIGPIDFSQLNFVRTEQTDYYYGRPDASSTSDFLLSKITQSRDPVIDFLMIAGLFLLFFTLLGFMIMKIRKMGK